MSDQVQERIEGLDIHEAIRRLCNLADIHQANRPVDLDQDMIRASYLEEWECHPGDFDLPPEFVIMPRAHLPAVMTSLDQGQIAIILDLSDEQVVLFPARGYHQQRGWDIADEVFQSALPAY